MARSDSVGTRSTSKERIYAAAAFAAMEEKNRRRCCCLCGLYYILFLIGAVREAVLCLSAAAGRAAPPLFE